MRCDDCGGTGEVTRIADPERDHFDGPVDVDCDTCNGVGWIGENPLLAEAARHPEDDYLDLLEQDADFRDAATSDYGQRAVDAALRLLRASA